jgi:hypothetical protein
MYENNTQNSGTRLIDEALTSEPIKNTFRLGWEFIKLNQKFTLTAMIIFVVLNLFGMIPIASLIFMVLSAVFGLVIQIHVGKTFYESQDIKSYINEIKESTIDKLLTRHVATAFGAYMGWVVLLLLLILLFGFIGGSMGIINEQMSEADLLNALVTLGFPMLLIALVLSYVQPLVQANIIMANGVQEGFKAVFTLFSTHVWRMAFKSAYFKYVAGFGLVIILLLFFFAFIVGLLTSLSGLTIVGNILMVILMYIFMLIMAVGSMMAKRTVELF